MATPAFGFSVGDFISAIRLVKKVSKALKDAGGASSQYQQVVIELKGLKNALRHLEALEPTEDNASHVNAIRGMALACQLPLREFLANLERYEPSMGPFAPKHSFRGAGRKAKWAVALAADVEKLRALLAAKVLSINLLLATHSSQALSKMESREKRQHNELMAMIVEHRAGLGLIQRGVQELQHGVFQAQLESYDNASRQVNMTRELRDEVKALSDSPACSIGRLDSISTATSSIQSSVMSLRDLGEQMARFISTFPTEIRGLLQKILRTNLQIYWLLLRSYNSVSAAPSLLCQSNIQFEDALGRVKGLPFEWFRHWEAFEGLLRADFKDVPGETNVLGGHYHIVDTKRRGSLIRKEDWNRSVFPGSAISMSMVISLLRREGTFCPRPSCNGEQGQATEQSDLLTCPKCGLNYYTSSTDFEDGFERVTILEEDDEVVQRQAKEDLLLHGSRPKPQDPEEISASMVDSRELDSPTRTRERNASDMQASDIERPSKTREQGDPERRSAIQTSDWGEQAIPNNNVTTIDWNSGKSPLDAWLNQSAFPSEILPLEPGVKEKETQEREATARETKEIEFFRNVHISASHRVRQEKEAMDFHSASDIDFGVRIYYRNIVDRYPLIPPYLARRLAEANFHRAERLRCQRYQAEQGEKMYHTKGMGECENTPVTGSEGADSSQNFKATTSESFRYRVTLNAPTAMVKHADEIPVTYLNMGQAYLLSIVDTARPPEAVLTCYRTSIRITFETEGHRHNPTECWQIWKELRGTNEAHQRGGKLHAVECTIEGVESTYCGFQTTSVKFERASVDGFSVEWMTRGYGALECNIPVKFNFLSTDFTHSRGVEGVPVRLCVKTEMVQGEPPLSFPLSFSTPEEAAELCHCRVKISEDHSARKLLDEVAHVENTIKKLKQQMSCEEVHLKTSASANKTGRAVTIRSKVKRQMRSGLRARTEENNEFDEEEELHLEKRRTLHQKLLRLHLEHQTLEDQLLTIPVSYLNLPGDEHDDPDLHPIFIRSILDDIRDGWRNPETSFWTGGNQDYRPPSTRSRSSSMNSSLHGTPTFDPEEQNPVFVRPRLQKSSAKISPYEPSESDEYSNCIPRPPLPRPRHIAGLSPNVYPSSSVVPSHRSQRKPHETVDAPPTLPPPPIELKRNLNSPFDCDICGETVEVDSAREWQ